MHRTHTTDHARDAKQEFLSKMNHEMLTPMNAIIGMTQTAKNSEDEHELAYCLDKIEDSALHLLGIIKDVLDMSEIEAGKFQLDRTSINIEKMLIGLCNLISGKIEEKGLQLSIILAKDMGMSFMGDDKRLSQVITNLLTNAIKFTSDRGKIVVNVEETPCGEQHSILRFSIRDNGIGMTEEEIDRVFEAFEQADNHLSRSFGGAGLGLSISRDIVEKMNGRIWVESEIDKGSVFSFEIRLERSEQPEGSVIFRNIQPKDVKVLIVDGDREGRSYFRLINDSFGINTDEAETVERAENLVKLANSSGQPYDIIFCDYGSSEVDGVEAARRIKPLIDVNTTIILVTSPLTWKRIERFVNSYGVDRYISKPLFPSLILDEINRVIGSTAKRFDIQSSHTSTLPDLSDVKLLLAEDVDINKEIFTSLIQETKMKVDYAENGEIVVRKFTENHELYDMIITDIHMPVMNGFEAVEKIRSLDCARAKSIPILAMTANSSGSDIQKCLEAGMNGHLAKPINIKALCDQIELYREKNFRV